MSPESFERTTLHTARRRCLSPTWSASDLQTPLLLFYDQSLCRPCGGLPSSSGQADRLSFRGFLQGSAFERWKSRRTERRCLFAYRLRGSRFTPTSRSQDRQAGVASTKSLIPGPPQTRRTTSGDNRVGDLFRGLMSFKTHKLNVSVSTWLANR